MGINAFTLSMSSERIFPVKVKTSSGEEFPIDANFRTVLKILRLHEDTEIFEIQKVLFTLKWFYGAECPSDTYEALQLLYNFVRGANFDDEDGKKSKPQFDYEFDAEEIYVSFIRDYNIDLCNIDFLHWYKFKMLLVNLSSESPFSQKMRLRFMDLNKFKGGDYAKLSKAKRKVQLPVKYTKEEAAMIEEMMKKLRS